MSDAMQNTGGACCHHHKATPRSEQELRLLQNRLKRMMGQLNGISKMLDENRYCGDILIQVAAVESALQSFGYLVLQDHLETCVVEEIQKGNTQIVDEAENRKIQRHRHDLRRLPGQRDPVRLQAGGRGGGKRQPAGQPDDRLLRRE